ncbi:MAG: cysteinyl-tRNA synthetase [Parcubacteria group bacterium Licking1014_17]|nr:MAG: cysteinyl-tRNA synthetase [Parcubacteria group bacterium Licking1014_17]
MLRIYNTLTNSKEYFLSSDTKIRMFVCGPTVYNYIHIGNARLFTVFDVVAKYLRYLGYKLSYIQNITDIDDKIINQAKENNETSETVAKRFLNEFYKDIKSLGITSVDSYPKASEHIPEIIGQIKKLVEKGAAYAVPSVAVSGEDAINDPANNDVYFSVAMFPEFGKLSKQQLDKLEAGARVETETNKRDPKDFVLWKAQNYIYEPSWDSPWGKGRPGWHIEDTAITEKYFGPQYEIHGGGQDLMFPHHEAEIAQQESISGLQPFVKYWMHAGFLTMKDDKMSKSTGNFITLRDAMEEYGMETLRFYFLSSHYRAPLDYADETIKQSAAATTRLAEFYLKLKSIKNSLKTEPNEKNFSAISTITGFFEKDMDDDFNTSRAFSRAFDLIRYASPLINDGSLDVESYKKIMETLDLMNSIFGIIPKELTEIPANVKKLCEERERARASKNYGQADYIRMQIQALGYRVDDTKYGPFIKKKTF